MAHMLKHFLLIASYCDVTLAASILLRNDPFPRLHQNLPALSMEYENMLYRGYIRIRFHIPF